jgi:hypothetical protein
MKWKNAVRSRLEWNLFSHWLVSASKLQARDLCQTTKKLSLTRKRLLTSATTKFLNSQHKNKLLKQREKKELLGHYLTALVKESQIKTLKERFVWLMTLFSTRTLPDFANTQSLKSSCRTLLSTESTVSLLKTKRKSQPTTKFWSILTAREKDQTKCLSKLKRPSKMNFLKTWTSAKLKLNCKRTSKVSSKDTRKHRKKLKTLSWKEPKRLSNLKLLLNKRKSQINQMMRSQMALFSQNSK